ncbi:MAG: sulfite exporter TauE/SafE family protein [Candidatus Gracilibacteria bacterium]|jgi:sulfite exporter TauE/SafE/copper chaperone CopZ
MKNLYHVAGMHCKSCEILLENEIRKIPDVTKVMASHKKGEILVESNSEIPLENITTSVEKYNYKIVSEGEKKSFSSQKNTIEDYIEIILLSLGIGILFFLITQFNVSKFFPDTSGSVNILMALVIGFVASISTCLALVGGIVIGFSEMYQISPDAKHPILSRLYPHLYFHAGRIIGFILLGGFLGLLGEKINLSISSTGIFTIVIALIMLYIGLSVLNIVPNITRLGFHLPKFLSFGLSKYNKKGHFAPIALGVFTFFVPCGFTQSMQLLAISSKNFFSGALIMGAFAIGTLPVLLSLGFGSSFAKTSKIPLLNRLIGIVIVFFALYSLNSGLVLSGSKINFDSLKPSTTTETAAPTGISNTGEQVVKMDVTYTFTPNEFRIKKGIPVRWEINGVNVSGCTNSIFVPELRIRKRLSQGLNVINFIPQNSGVLNFSCGMGMVTGRFIVE